MRDQNEKMLQTEALDSETSGLRAKTIDLRQKVRMTEAQADSNHQDVAMIRQQGANLAEELRNMKLKEEQASMQAARERGNGEKGRRPDPSDPLQAARVQKR